jgi:hypothetical protein
MKNDAELAERRKKEMKRLDLLKAEEAAAGRAILAKEKRLMQIVKRRNRMTARRGEDKKERLAKKKAIRIENTEKEKNKRQEEQKQNSLEYAKYMIQYKHAVDAAKHLREEKVAKHKVLVSENAIMKEVRGNELANKINSSLTSVWDASKAPLCTSAKFESLLKSAVADGFELDERSSKTGETLIHIACWEGNFNAVKILIEAGVSVDIIDTTVNKTTPLLEAARAGWAEVCQYLISKGANVLLTDKHGNSALHYASQIGIPSLVRDILHAPNGSSLLTLKNYKMQLPIDVVANGSCRYILHRAMSVINPKLATKAPTIEIQDDCQEEESLESPQSIDQVQASKDVSVLHKTKYTNKAKPLPSLRK